jgi:hypothetical protein
VPCQAGLPSGGDLSSAPGHDEYIRVFYIAHASSGCLLEYQPDRQASPQPKFPAQATRARNFPRLLITPGSWMSCVRATIRWRRRANLETASPHISLMFFAFRCQDSVGPPGPRYFRSTAEVQRTFSMRVPPQWTALSLFHSAGVAANRWPLHETVSS